MRIGFGCVNLGSVSGGRSMGDDVRLLEEAIDSGVEVLDTADAYAKGASERIVGRAIRTRRDRVEVATKGGYRFRERSQAEIVGRRLVKSARDRVRPAAPVSVDAAETPAETRYATQDFSPGALRAALHASLQRLHTDHVDVYQLHGPPHRLPDLIGELADLVTAGKVRRFGVGAESIAAAAEWSDVAGIDVVQLPVGVLDAYAVETAIEIGARGREVWARGVFAGGVLAAAERDPTLVQRDPKGPLISGLREVADRHDLSIFALALGFVRSIPGISTVLLGMSTPEHLRRNLELFAAPELPPDVLAEVWALLTPGVDSGANGERTRRRRRSGGRDRERSHRCHGCGPPRRGRRGRHDARRRHACAARPPGQAGRQDGLPVRQPSRARRRPTRHRDVRRRRLDIEPVARRVVQLLDGGRPPLRPRRLHRGRAAPRALRVARHLRRARPPLRVRRGAARRHDGARPDPRGSREHDARHHDTPPADWQEIIEAANRAGHPLGMLPMAKGSPWMVARRAREFASYQCVVAPLLTERSFELRRGAFAVGLRWDPHERRVDAVDYVDVVTGQRTTLRCRAVVVAAGTIDSTVLLLRSRSDDFPTGLGNSSGLVGQYLHDHPREWWVGHSERPLRSLAHPVYVAGERDGPTEPMLATSLTIGLSSAADRLRTFVRGTSRTFGVQVFGTMVPQPVDGVTLTDPVGTADRPTDPHPRIRLQFDERAMANLVSARERLREIMAAAGVDVTVPGPFHDVRPGTAVHFGGTVRMHRSPAYGALDPWSRLRDRTQRRGRRRQRLHDRPREEPDAHRDGPRRARGGPAGRRPRRDRRSSGVSPPLTGSRPPRNRLPGRRR